MQLSAYEDKAVHNLPRAPLHEASSDSNARHAPVMVEAILLQVTLDVFSGEQLGRWHQIHQNLHSHRKIR